jgi:hypothetical protein
LVKKITGRVKRRIKMEEILKLMKDYENIKSEIINEFLGDKRVEIDDKIKSIYAIITKATMLKIKDSKMP